MKTFEEDFFPIRETSPKTLLCTLPARYFSYVFGIIWVQTLECLWDLHEIGFLHRDVKPQNFAIGPINEMQIYIFDFGIARKIFEENGQVRKARPDGLVRFSGTPRYASIRNHQHCEQGRKCDIESWLYMMYDLFDRDDGLPWKRVDQTERNALKNILKIKMAFMENQGCIGSESADIPSGFSEIISMIKKLEYEDRPDYEGILKHIQEIRDTVPIPYHANLDWIGKEVAEMKDQCQDNIVLSVDAQPMNMGGKK